MSEHAAGRHPLFRDQVREHRRERLYGEIVINDNRIWSRSVACIAALAIGLALWAATATYPRTAQVPGLVVSSRSVAKIFVTRAGTIDRLYVHEGSRVRRGDPLAFVSVDVQDGARQGAARSSLLALDQQRSDVALQLNAAGRVSEDEVRRLDTAARSNLAEQQALETQQSMARAIVASMESALERLTPVLEKGFISKFEMERREQALFAQRQQLAQMAQQAVQLRARQADLRSQLRQLPLERARRSAELDAQLGGLAEQRSRASVDVGYMIVAPVDGQVTSLQAGTGRTFDPRVLLMTVVPDTAAMEAQLYVPSRAVGFVRPGQRVRIMYDAFPYKQFGTFGGTISNVSRASLAPQDVDAAVRIEEPVYPVRVALGRQSVPAFDRSMPLQLGMTLNASVVLDERSFIDWLMEPLNAVRRRG